MFFLKPKKKKKEEEVEQVEEEKEPNIGKAGNRKILKMGYKLMKR